MTVPTNPPEARRSSLLSRVYHLVDGGIARRFAENTAPPVSLPAPIPVASRENVSSHHLEPPEPRLYLEARRQIKRRAWGHAQRALEAAVVEEIDAPARLDLDSVRTVRRALRRAARWPSDVDAHLDLGRAYFELDLGDDALAEFTLAQRIAPNRFEPFVLSALEYLYRGEYARAMRAWSRAAALKPELGSFDDVLGSLPVT